MKILQISNSFSPIIGGQEKVVLEISKRLVSKGHQVTVLTSDYMCEKKCPKNEILNGIKIIRLKNKRWLAGYGHVPDLSKWIKKNYSKFDLAHLHGFNRYMAEFGLKFLYNKIPTVFSAHGFNHTKKNLIFKKIHDKTIGNFLKKADLCTALTKLDFIEYKKLGIKKSNIIEIANGVDIESFIKNKKDIERFKKKYNLGVNVLLAIGRIHESKGIQHIISAIKRIDCQLLIVGPDGGYKKILEAQIKKERLEDKIIFAGILDEQDIITAGFSSKICLLTSTWEGFGIAAIEGMAAGLPVIGSNHGALPFLIKKQKKWISSELRKY